MHACARRKTKGIVTARFYLPGPTFELTVSNNRLQKKQTSRQQQIAGIPIRSFRSVHWHEESKDKVIEALSPIGRSTKRQNTRPACGQKTDIRCAATAQGSVPSLEDTVRLLNPQPGSGRQTMQDEAVVVRYGAIAPNTGGNYSIAILPISNLRYRCTTRRAKANRRVRNKSGGAIATGKSRYSQAGNFSSIRHHRHGDRGVAPVRTDSVGIPGYRPAGGRTNPDAGQRT